MHGEMKYAKLLFRKPEWKDHLKTRHRTVGNIKTDLLETGWQTWIGLMWLRKGTCGRLMQTW